jgi:hypothetical protein
VVGRLTARHGMRVRLARREGRDGLCASLLVPANLVAGEPGSIPLPAPARPVEPIGEPATAVAGRLHTAGIDVELADVPTARTPASILFEAVVPAEPADGSFTWLHRPGATAEKTAETPWQVAPTPLMEHQTGPNGLPGRGRDAERSRGFLIGFQAGVRQNEARKGAREE